MLSSLALCCVSALAVEAHLWLTHERKPPLNLPPFFQPPLSQTHHHYQTPWLSPFPNNAQTSGQTSLGNQPENSSENQRQRLSFQSRGGGGEIIEVEGGHILRATGRKDRHSKVCTAKGPRDRRVRLAAHTAIQFYDVQDRLGYDRPSKAVDWLINKAKPAIDELKKRTHGQSSSHGNAPCPFGEVDLGGAPHKRSASLLNDQTQLPFSSSGAEVPQLDFLPPNQRPFLEQGIQQGWAQMEVGSSFMSGFHGVSSSFPEGGTLQSSSAESYLGLISPVGFVPGVYPGFRIPARFRGDEEQDDAKLSDPPSTFAHH
ncbi:hypothetical protein AMTRI_Chr08g166520 [Amborella trichopoda]